MSFFFSPLLKLATGRCEGTVANVLSVSANHFTKSHYAGEIEN